MKYEIFERVYSGHWFMNSYNLRGWVKDLPKLGGGNFISKFIGIMDQGVCKYVMDQAEFEASANSQADRLINNHRWRNWMYQKVDYYTKHYYQVGERLRKLELKRLSDEDLIKEINRIIPLQRWHHVYSIIVNGLVIDGRNHLSNMIRHELNLAIKNTTKFDEYWAFLTQVTKMSLRQQKELALAKLAERTGKNSQSAIERQLKKLHQQYCWLDYQYLGPEASIQQFQEELKLANKCNKNLNLEYQLSVIKTKQHKLMRKLSFTKRLRFLVNLAQQVIWQKGYRKDMQYHGFYCFESTYSSGLCPVRIPYSLSLYGILIEYD